MSKKRAPRDREEKLAQPAREIVQQAAAQGPFLPQPVSEILKQPVSRRAPKENRVATSVPVKGGE